MARLQDAKNQSAKNAADGQSEATEKVESSEPLIYRLLMRQTLLFALFLTALLLFYVIGNYQNFLDENQSLILRAVGASAVPLLFFSAAGFVVSLVRAFQKTAHRVRHVATTICSLVAFAYALAAMFAARIISFLAGGM